MSEEQQEEEYTPKILTAKEICDLEVKEELKEVLDKTVEKALDMMSQFARTAKQSGSLFFKIPVEAVKNYIERTFEPRAEMLCITEDVYQAVIDDMLGLGYTLEFETSVNRAGDPVKLISVTWL